MPLSGVNRKCQQCTKTCKQWKEMKVIICPHFVSNQKSLAETEGIPPFKREETPKSASTEAINVI